MLLLGELYKLFSHLSPHHLLQIQCLKPIPWTQPFLPEPSRETASRKSPWGDINFLMTQRALFGCQEASATEDNRKHPQMTTSRVYPDTYEATRSPGSEFTVMPGSTGNCCFFGHSFLPMSQQQTQFPPWTLSGGQATWGRWQQSWKVRPRVWTVCFVALEGLGYHCQDVETAGCFQLSASYSKSLFTVKGQYPTHKCTQPHQCHLYLSGHSLS